MRFFTTYVFCKHGSFKQDCIT